MVDLPKRIDRFLRIASRYWQHYQLERIEEGILATAAREKSQAGNARFFADLMKHQRNRNSARKALVKIGRVLAVELEKRGEDSTALLHLLNVADGGGGPAVAGSLWGPVKAALQRLAIRADLLPEAAGGGTTPEEANKTAMKLAKKDPAFVNDGKGTASQTTRWERLKKWALNNWLVVAFLAILAVVVSLAALGSGLETLISWMRRFIVWLWL